MVLTPGGVVDADDVFAARHEIERLKKDLTDKHDAAHEHYYDMRDERDEAEKKLARAERSIRKLRTMPVELSALLERAEAADRELAQLQTQKEHWQEDLRRVERERDKTIEERDEAQQKYAAHIADCDNRETQKLYRRQHDEACEASRLAQGEMHDLRGQVDRREASLRCIAEAAGVDANETGPNWAHHVRVRVVKEIKRLADAAVTDPFVRRSQEIDRLKAENLKMREAAKPLRGFRVFLVSREKAKHPEGAQLFDEICDALAPTTEVNEK